MTKAKFAISFKPTWWFLHVTVPLAVFRSKLGFSVDFEALIKHGIDTAKIEPHIIFADNEENK